MHDNCYHAQTAAADALCEASGEGICTYYCHSEMAWYTHPVDDAGQLTCDSCYHFTCGRGHATDYERGQCDV